MPCKTKNYKDDLLKRLKDPDYAKQYLNAILESLDEDNNIEAFLLGLRDVATANGVSNIAQQTKLGRESLYKTLSEKGNPKLATLFTLLTSMKLRIKLESINR